MASHYRAQSAQMRSRSVDTRQQPGAQRYDSVGAVSTGSTATAMGWGNRGFGMGMTPARKGGFGSGTGFGSRFGGGFGASSAAGTSQGVGQRSHDDQFLASRGWKPILRATSTPNRSGSSATPSLRAQGTDLSGQGGCRRRLLVGRGYSRHYQYEQDLSDQKEEESKEQDQT